MAQYYWIMQRHVHTGCSGYTTMTQYFHHTKCDGYITAWSSGVPQWYFHRTGCDGCISVTLYFGGKWWHFFWTCCIGFAVIMHSSEIRQWYTLHTRRYGMLTIVTHIDERMQVGSGDFWTTDVMVVHQWLYALQLGSVISSIIMFAFDMQEVTLPSSRTPNHDGITVMLMVMTRLLQHTRRTAWRFRLALN
jgi:hypothetical protein